jgi:hypothetical protein
MGFESLYGHPSTPHFVLRKTAKGPTVQTIVLRSIITYGPSS